MKQIRYIGGSHVRILTDEDLQTAYGLSHKDGIRFDIRDPKQNKDGISVSNALGEKLIESGEWELIYDHPHSSSKKEDDTEDTDTEPEATVADLAPAVPSPEGSPAVPTKSGQGRAK